MAAPRKYPLELRERAVRMYRTSDPKPVIRRIAEELGVHPEALRNWIRQAEADAGERDDVLTTAEREELAALRGENVQLRRANEVLRTASAFFAAMTDPDQAKVLMSCSHWSVRVTVPAGWSHVGLLPAPVTGDRAWVYPCEPGTTFTTWVGGPRPTRGRTGHCRRRGAGRRNRTTCRTPSGSSRPGARTRRRSSPAPAARRCVRPRRSPALSLAPASTVRRVRRHPRLRAVTRRLTCELTPGPSRLRGWSPARPRRLVVLERARAAALDPAMTYSTQRSAEYLERGAWTERRTGTWPTCARRPPQRADR